MNSILSSEWWVVLVVSTALSGCAVSANYGPNAEANKVQTRTFQARFDVAYRTAIQVAAEQHWRVLNSEKDAGYFLAKTPESLKAWGDEVNVTIVAIEDGVKVTVTSRLGQSQNREVVSRFLEALQNKLDSLDN